MQKKLTFPTRFEADKCKLFTENYAVANILTGRDNVVLKNEANDISCRFCMRKKNEVSFKQKTHVIPQLLNKALPKSNFECDDCNAKFSKYESDLGHFLLLERSIFGQKKKKGGYPKAKTKGGGSVQRISTLDRFKGKLSNELIHKINTEETINIEIIQDKDGSSIEVEDNQIRLKMLRPPYRPLNVYRVFLKLGLSLVSEIELKNFENINQVLGGSLPGKYGKGFKLFKYEIPILKNYFFHPIVYLFKRFTNNLNLCNYYVVLFFGNSIYQIPMYTDTDCENRNLKMINFSPYLNPLITEFDEYDTEMYNALSKVKSYFWDLSSYELLKNNMQYLFLEQINNKK